MRLWLIDAGYLFKAVPFRLDYLKLRQEIEKSGAIWRGYYYLNSTPHPPTDAQDGFHTWLRSAPPRGPKLITKLYELKDVRADRAFCKQCGKKMQLVCPHGTAHELANQQQKGVDVAIATLALIHREKYQTLLLSSGDGDLLDAIEFLSEQGKRIELVVSPRVFRPTSKRGPTRCTGSTISPMFVVQVTDTCTRNPHARGHLFELADSPRLAPTMAHRNPYTSPTPIARVRPRLLRTVSMM